MAVLAIFELLTVKETAFAVDEDCKIVADYETSQKSYESHYVNCDSDVVISDETLARTQKLRVLLLTACKIFPTSLFGTSNRARSLSHVYIHDDSNTVEQLEVGSFDELTHVKELSLVGFVHLKQVFNSVFRPLQSLERLFLKGFGFGYLTYKDVGSALNSLSGSPLQTIVMDSIRGVRSRGKVLDVEELFQIRNVSIRNWVFSNNLVTEYAGMVSEVLPDLQYFCMGIVGPIDFASYAVFMIDLLTRSKNLQDFTIYSLSSSMLSSRITGDSSMEIFQQMLYNERLYLHLTQFLDRNCYLGFAVPVSPSLKHVAIRGELMYYPDSGDLGCIHPQNQVESAFLSELYIAYEMPLINGLNKLKNLTISTTHVRRFPLKFFEYLPLLEVFIVDTMLLGRFVETLTSGFFGSCPTLRIIKMTKCNLTKIPEQLFASLPHFVQLDVSNNKLTEFEISLNHNENFSLLNLAQNAIDTLPASLTWRLSILADNRREQGDRLTVNLTGNILSCHCNNTGFVRWIVASAVNNSIYFPNVDSYECVLPNGNRSYVVEVDVDKVEDQCSVMKYFDNGSECPCDDVTRENLKLIRFSLDRHYCRSIDGELVVMNVPLPACINIYLTVQFLASVVVVGVLVVAFVTSIVLLYKFRHNARLQPIVDCLNFQSVIAFALNTLMLQSRKEDQSSFTYDVFLHAHELDHDAEDAIAERLLGSHQILTQNYLTPGVAILDALNECTRQCRWIVPVLTPVSVADPLFMDYVNRVLFDRPHALVPIVWRPLTADEDNSTTIAELFKVSVPICWPGSADGEGMNERRQVFWNSLVARIHNNFAAETS